MMKKILFVLIATVLLLALVEGLISWGLLFFDFATKSERPLAARTHTQFDPELGWAPQPGRQVVDLYGEGKDVTLDDRGFRFSGARPDGGEGQEPKIIVCSGDSFTFGYGVGDSETWVHRLQECEEHWMTINMGQGGYGLDQAYLWYRRDGVQLDHDVHLFAVIHDDFRRMQRDSFLGYGKPTLVLEQGAVKAASVPVDEGGFRWPWWTQNRRLLSGLRSAQLFSRSSRNDASAPPTLASDEVRDVALAAMKELNVEHREAGRVFAFIWLPTREDARPGRGRDAVRRDFVGSLRQAGIVVIDLVDTVRGEPLEELNKWFIAPGEIDYRGAEGHYTAYGNQKMAKALHQQLQAISILARALAK